MLLHIFVLYQCILLNYNLPNIYVFDMRAGTNVHGLSYIDLASKGSYELEKYERKY